MKNLIAVLLLMVSCVLAYFCYTSIMTPIKFEQERKLRQAEVVEKLTDIRDIQVQFQTDSNRYCNNIDELIQYAKVAQVTTISKIGDISDAMREKGMTEKEAVKKGIIKRDTIRTKFLYENFKPSSNIDSLAFVPYGNGEKFIMSAKMVQTVSNVDLPVFEAKCPYEVYLQGMNRQMIINMREDAIQYNKYPGLQVGSVTTPNNNAGNWE